MKLAGAVLTVITLAALWLLFAPTQIGGQAGYVIVAGDSMEPALSSGDLVIIRDTAESNVGDVVTYQHPELGVVIHRIIGIEGNRFILQGDNNSWIDSHEPVQSEISGKLWFAIPGAGRYLGLVQQPAALALLSIVMGLTVMLPRRKTESTKPRATTGWLPTLMEPGGRDLLGLFAVIAIGALLVAGLAFSRSIERETAREVTYEHHGSFSYSAAAPEGIYDTAEVGSGEPIFLTLTDSFDVQFDYALESRAPIESAGTAGLRAELSTVNGWKRNFDLQAATDFEGLATTVSGQVDLREMQQIISRVEAETGVAIRQYMLTIQPDLIVDATIGGEPVQEQFAPEITFQLDAQQLQLMRTSTSDENVLAPGMGGLVTQTGIEDNAFSLMLFEVDVTLARQGSLAALALVFAAVTALAVQTYRARGRTAVEHLASTYGPRLVSVRSGAEIDTETTVEVSGVKDFERLLKHHLGPIFHESESFYIDHDGQRYRFGPAQHLPSSEVSETVELEQEKPAPAQPPQQAVQPKPRRQFAISHILFKSRNRMERA